MSEYSRRYLVEGGYWPATESAPTCTLQAVDELLSKREVEKWFYADYERAFWWQFVMTLPERREKSNAVFVQIMQTITGKEAEYPRSMKHYCIRNKQKFSDRVNNAREGGFNILVEVAPFHVVGLKPVGENKGDLWEFVGNVPDKILNRYGGVKLTTEEVFKEMYVPRGKQGKVIKSNLMIFPPENKK